MFIIVLGQHISILIESPSGPSKNTDPYLAMFKLRCGIPGACILDTTVYKMHLLLYSYHHHHHHVPEGLGVFPVP